MNGFSSKQIGIGLVLLFGSCAKHDVSLQGNPPKLQRVLKNLKGLQWVSGQDLSFEKVSLAGRKGRIPALHAPASHKGFGFADGSTENLITRELTLTVRGRLIVIPAHHCSDLYNLQYDDPSQIRFASSGRVDLVQIHGSSGERGYSVTYFLCEDVYLGRRMTTYFSNYDDFEGLPRQTSDRMPLN